MSPSTLPLHVLLDANVLGRGFTEGATRTGIFRASEQLIRAIRNRSDVTVSCSAEASWVSELQLLRYNELRQGDLEDCILRAWTHPTSGDEEGSRLIARVLEIESRGEAARRDRAGLTLLNATAQRRSLGPFDVVHSLRTPLPAGDRVKGRVRVLTVHDLIPLHHPEWCPEGAEAVLQEILASVDLRTDFLIVNSEMTAREVLDHLPISETRVFVTPFAADPATFYREEDPDIIAGVRARYRIPAGRFVVSVGTLERRKNLAHLVRCFFELLDQERWKDVTLVLVGPTGWKTEDTFAAIEARPDLRDRIVLPGYVEDRDLAAIYSGANVFVFPSLYEGFGLPLLEAMRCGTPVISSNAGALPEVAGEAAWLVSPGDRDALRELLGTLLKDPDRGEELRRKGLALAARFTWERTAALTIEAYRTMLAAD